MMTESVPQPEDKGGRASEATMRPRGRATKARRPRAARERGPAMRPPPMAASAMLRQRRAEWNDGRVAAIRIRSASSRPIASSQNAEVHASLRSWPRSRAPAAPRPSAPTSAPAHRSGEPCYTGPSSGALDGKHAMSARGPPWPGSRRTLRRAATRRSRARLAVRGRRARRRGRERARDLLECAESGIGPASSGPSSMYRSTNGCSSAFVASTALLRASKSPRPSRCCRRSSARRVCASRSGARNASRVAHGRRPARRHPVEICGGGSQAAARTQPLANGRLRHRSRKTRKAAAAQGSANPSPRWPRHRSAARDPRRPVRCDRVTTQRPMATAGEPPRR